MTEDKSSNIFVFPKWTWILRPGIAAALFGGVVYATVVVAFGFSPLATDVGYAPEQPVAYSHAVHVGQLGIDCRYCHNTVEESAHASIPPTQTCMNCHSSIRTNSEKLIPVRSSYATGMPVEWVRVHDLPDYVYFDHSAHVRRGIGCASCHGRVDTMEVVSQVEALSMGWCLVTMLDWVPEEEQLVLGRRLREELNINPRVDCNTCHR
jgi:hypothetical protein